MPNPKILEPVEGEDPCGPDLQWEQDFIQLKQDFEAAKIQGADAAIIDGQLASTAQLDFEDILSAAEDMCQRTKDLRILAIYVEASWLENGLKGFVETLEDTLTAIETWPDPKEGIWPRADEDDGDLGERVASLGRLMSRVPFLVNTVGWGATMPEITERKEVSTAAKALFIGWDDRLATPFENNPPSILDAWKAVQKITDDDHGGAVEAGGAKAAPSDAVSGDAWDLVERAAEVMALQDRHSPALPMLRLISTWRAFGITDIADKMKTSGVSLEQLLESVKRQTQSGVPAPAGGMSPAAPAPLAPPTLPPPIPPKAS